MLVGFTQNIQNRKKRSEDNFFLHIIPEVCVVFFFSVLCAFPRNLCITRTTAWRLGHSIFYRLGDVGTAIPSSHINPRPSAVRFVVVPHRCSVFAFFSGPPWLLTIRLRSVSRFHQDARVQLPHSEKF